MLRSFSALILLLCYLICCQNSTIHKVELQKTETGYQLLRDGDPFFINGAGANGHYDLLADYGGNSIRTWGVDQWEETFQQAEKVGLTVCAGLWLEQERQGFDYSDPDTVQMQFDKLKKWILKYKDHPSLLMWGIGNELDLQYTNVKVWDAVEEVAKYIHEVDGCHPTMTATAFIEKDEVNQIKEKCPHIDILCINAYAGIPVLSQFLNDFGWNKPYILGEWGPMGHWEVGQTSWNAPIEFTSTEKAALYINHYKHITKDPNCLGGYVFLWGYKQERTATWYSLFLSDGEKTEAVDVLSMLWKGEWPDNRAPRLDSLKLNRKTAAEQLIFNAGNKLTANVLTHDPDNDSLKIVWEILNESTQNSIGGDEENKPMMIPGLIIQQKEQSLTFQAPQEEGAYRLFVTVYDQEGSGAHANIPFYVKKN
ncbi:glycoside hydrolase family 2 TIM barrel-domain containing protein [bacterium]